METGPLYWASLPRREKNEVVGVEADETKCLVTEIAA